MSFFGVIVTGALLIGVLDSLFPAPGIAAFRLCRIASDTVCVLTGLLCHVTIGAGTVVTALFMGPVVQWFNTHVSEPFLYGSKQR